MNNDDFFKTTKTDKMLTKQSFSGDPSKFDKQYEVKLPDGYKNESMILIRDTDLIGLRNAASEVKRTRVWSALKSFTLTLSGIFFGAYVSFAIPIGKFVSFKGQTEALGTFGLLALTVVTLAFWLFLKEKEAKSSFELAEMILKVPFESHEGEK